MTTWREVPRSELYKTVITAVDAAKGEAVELGDESFVRLCDEQLFPFLYAELERARKAERAAESAGDVAITGHHKERGERGY